MSFGDLGKSFERLMRCTDNALQTGTDAGPQRQTANHAYHKCLRTTNEIWKRLEVRVHQATGHEKASPARAWLDTHLERKLFFRMEILLITVRDNAEVAACSTASATTRCDGLQGWPLMGCHHDGTRICSLCEAYTRIYAQAL